MAIEVLAPQDLLVERCRKQPRSYRRRRNSPANAVSNQKQHKKASSKPDKSKLKAPSVAKKLGHGGDTDTRDAASNGVVMGQVRILRRGESLSSVVCEIAAAAREASIREPVNDLAVSGEATTETELPKVIPKQIRRISAPPADFYAGSACYLSPSPRALPLPSFFNKDGIAKHLRTLELQ